MNLLRSLSTVLVTFLIAFTATAVHGQEKKKGVDPELKKSVDEIRQKANEAWNKGDAMAVAELYAPGADIIDIDGTVYKGRKKIEKRVKEIITSSNGLKVKITSQSVRFLGKNLAVDDGDWEISGGPAGHPNRGKYTVLMARRQGNWVVICHRLMVPVK